MTSSQGHQWSRARMGSQVCSSEALNRTRAHGHLTKTAPTPPGTQNQQMPPVPWTAQMSGKWAPAAHPHGGPHTEWPHSGCGLALLGGSGTENQGRADQGPGALGLPSPRLPPPRSGTHLAVVLGVQGSAGLAEEGGVCGHIGETGDDLIKVPVGARQSGKADHKVIVQTQTLLLSERNCQTMTRPDP